MRIVKVEWDYANEGLDPRGQWLSHAEVYAGDRPAFAEASRLACVEKTRRCFFHIAEDDRPRWYFVRLVDTAGNVSLPIGAQASPAD